MTKLDLLEWKYNTSGVFFRVLKFFVQKVSNFLTLVFGLPDHVLYLRHLQA